MAQLKVAAVLLIAVLLLAAAAGHGHFTTHAEEQPPAPPPALVVRATTPPAFVPKGGKLSAPIPIAMRFPWAHSLEWNFDGTKLLGTVDHRWKENRGSLSREGPDEVESYTIDLATKAVTKVFENQGTPKWLAGDRLFVVLDGTATIVEADGERHALPAKKYVYPLPSHDGKYLAYYSLNEQDGRFLQPMMLYSVVDRSVTELHPPAEESPSPDAQLQQHLGFWNDENRLCVRTGWKKEKPGVDYNRAMASFYTPATKTYARAEYYANNWSFEQYTFRRDRLMLTGGTWLAVEGPADWKEPPRESAPNAPRGEGKGRDGNEPRLAKPAVAFSFHDESGTELRRVPLDTDAINHGALVIHAVSSDQKFMVASGYHSDSPHPGLPVSLEKTYVIDLANGKVIATLTTGDLDIRTARPIAIFSPTRQVLAVARTKTGGHQGIYAFGFDDKPPRELGAGKGLPNFLVDGDNSVWPDYISRLSGTERHDCDHMTVVADPLNFANVLDPKYENEPHQLFVFWNSATPIRAFASDSRTNRPTNVTWSHDGKKLAFISGTNVYIWEPQAEGTEFQMPKATSSEDF
jgi:hypothetical protein